MAVLSNLLSQNFAGFTGSKGFTGSAGAAGETGFTGSIGFTGSQGIGFTGSQGAGFTGSQGATGDTGFTGSVGFTGSQGAKVANTAPVSPLEGQLWYDTSDGTFNVYNGSTWVVTSGPAGPTGADGSVGFTGSRGFTGSAGSPGPAGTSGVNGTIAEVANTAPTPAATGQLWYDVTDGTVSVYNGSTWVVTSGPAGPTGADGIGFVGSRGFTGSAGAAGFVGSSGANGTLAEVANTAPVSATEGQLWYDVNDGTISVYNGNTWVVTSGPIGPPGGNGFTGSAGFTGSTGKVIDSILTETTSRSLTLADSSDMIFVNTASNTTFTIPTDASVNFPIPTTIHFARNGTGTVTIAGDVGVTVRIRNGFTNTLAVQYSIASVTKVAANTWYLYGDLT